MTNKERFVEFARKHNIAKSEEILDRRLAIIPELSRKVVETRWGLNGGIYCLRFDALEEKLGLQNSTELYTKAMHDLENAAFAEVIADRKEIGDWNAIVGLGRLATLSLMLHFRDFASADDIGTDMVSGKGLLETVFNCLTQREKNVIFLRFGFDGNGTKPLQEVGDTLGIKKERVRQVESKAIRKLGMGVFVKQFYIPYIAKEEKTQQEGATETKGTRIDELDFCIRTHNILKRANLNTAEDILNNPHKLLAVRGFGKKTASEIMQVLEPTGIASVEGKTAKEVFDSLLQQLENPTIN